MIRSNFRGTREISGDFRAQTAANRLGRPADRGAGRPARRGHADAVPRGAAALHGAAHARRLRRVPRRHVQRRHAHGRRRRHRRAGEAGRHGHDRVRAACPSISPAATTQRKSPTNATSSQTYSGVVYVLKCLIDPDIPVNDGFYRLVDIRSRPGSVVHAQHPAAVAAGWEIAMQLCDLLFRRWRPRCPTAWWPAPRAASATSPSAA